MVFSYRSWVPVGSREGDLPGRLCAWHCRPGVALVATYRVVRSSWDVGAGVTFVREVEMNPVGASS